jgi:hypothetical protein
MVEMWMKALDFAKKPCFTDFETWMFAQDSFSIFSLTTDLRGVQEDFPYFNFGNISRLKYHQQKQITRLLSQCMRMDWMAFESETWGFYLEHWATDYILQMFLIYIVCRLRYQSQRVVKIQALWRGYIVRKEVHHHPDYLFKSEERLKKIGVFDSFKKMN